MSIARYRWRGNFTNRDLESQIPQGFTAAIQRAGPTVFVDIEVLPQLTGSKADLDEFMETLGWAFVDQNPTFGPPTNLPTTVQAGTNGDTLAGAFYRGINGMLLNGGPRGIPVPTGTLRFLGWSKTSAAASTLEVLNNGVVIATLANPAAGVVTSEPKVPVDVGLLSFRNLAAGATTTNVQITALVC